MIYAEIGWVLVSSVTQVQLKVILDPDCLPDYLFVSYEYDFPREIFIKFLRPVVYIFKRTYNS